MRYKTLSLEKAKVVNKCDGECVYGYVGEKSYHCKHCLGVKDTEETPPKFTEVGGTGSAFDHATTVPTYHLKYLHFLCNKGERIWVK